MGLQTACEQAQKRKISHAFCHQAEYDCFSHRRTAAELTRGGFLSSSIFMHTLSHADRVGESAMETNARQLTLGFCKVCSPIEKIRAAQDGSLNLAGEIMHERHAYFVSGPKTTPCSAFSRSSL